jgi:flagellar biosynthesis component FlhA
MRKLRRILTVVAIVLAGWLIYSLVSGEALSPMVILGILLILFFAILLSKQRQPERSRQSDVEVSPSQRKSKNQHKSWINRTDLNK